ncbi:MAG: hypothetical protein QG559_1790, partial [Campylobacterota bacterium]|nr:hypothetical protein [Campylobacterota bacterium]
MININKRVSEVKNLSIKARLSVLSIAPILVIVALSVGKIFFDISVKENLEATKERIQEVESLAKAIHYIQIERGLSVGYVASKANNNKDTIPAMREKVNSAIEDIKKVYTQTKGDSSVLNALSDLDKKRAAIDTLSISAPDTGAYFSQTITELIDSAVTIPSNMDDREGRNIIQAYTHLASAKEQLGQTRANLNGAFTKNEFVGNTYFTFSGSISAYKINLNKFTTLAPEELRKFHEGKFSGEVVTNSMKMIDIAIEKNMQGNFGIEPSDWFKNVTASIDLLREVELELYKYVHALVDEKIEKISFNIILLSAGLFIGILVFAAFIFFLTKISISKPIEEFKTTLLKISSNHDLTIRADVNTPLELSQMAQGFNKLLATLRDIIETSKQSSSENASISHELSTTALGVGENVEKSVAVIDEATKKANSIKNEIQEAIQEAAE